MWSDQKLTISSPIKLGYFLLLIILLSCESEKAETTRNQLNSFVETSSIRLPLDKRTSFEFLKVSYFNAPLDSNEYIIVVNENINGFNIYDLGDLRLVSQISMPRQGPGKIGRIQGLAVKNLDSIYVMSAGSLSRIELYDSKGQHKNSIKSSGVPEREINGRIVSFFNHQSNSTAPSLIRDNKIYFTQYPMFDFYRKSNIRKLPLEFSMDLKSNELEPIDIFWPEWTHGNIWHMYYLLPGKAIDDRSNLLYSFLGIDSVYVLNLRTKEFQSHFAGYSGAKKIKPYKKKIDRDKELEDGIQSTLYTQILFDPFRNLYYRVVSAPMTYNEDKHKSYLAYYEKPTVLVILNRDFEIIKEVELPKNEYRSYGLFVGKKGLYIPKLHPEYEQFSEDYIDYDIFTYQD